MSPTVPSDNPVASDLLAAMESARARAADDPFGNPVLAVALLISRHIDEGDLREADLAALIRDLRDRALVARAKRLASYCGLTGTPASARYNALAAALIRPDPNDSPVRFADFRANIERTCFAAVFTAHPTFAIPDAVARDIAALASGETAALCHISHRPQKPSLAEEFAQSLVALHHGCAAIDQLNIAILREAEKTWPDRGASLTPRAIILSSWVGFDTDGRTDIGWWDSLRYRLMLKQEGLQSIARALTDLPAASLLHEKLTAAAGAVTQQIAFCPGSNDAAETEKFAHCLMNTRVIALLAAQDLSKDFDAALAASAGAEKITLAALRARFFTHGLSLAHMHVRLNAAQIENAIRVAGGIGLSAEDRAQRRSLLAALNNALEQVKIEKLDFGTLLTEQASAMRLMMLVAQIVKHVDRVTPIRFLIAETESGATLLSALLLARRFGIAEHIEISPLFETADALEQGTRVLEEALRSPHYRAYLKETGRLALQFGYSDSGRYIGQLAASYMIERLRLKLAALLKHHKLEDVELVLFDTHGESIGRGGHPRGMHDRLRYLSPETARAALSDAGIKFREESAFQGGDGYLNFKTPVLAAGTIAAIAEHALLTLPQPRDPIYTDPDFSADFFNTIAHAMRDLVEDAGYAALLGAFGPALLDPTGSRPSARQNDAGGPSIIRHPSELRAIPNNAILQQLGWCANTLHGIGQAASRAPEIFADQREQSDRFARALELAAHGLKHSDIDVLRAVISLIDPGSWLDRAAQAKRPGRARALMDVAAGLETLQLWAPAQAMFRKVQSDHLLLRAAWPDAPRMNDDEMLLHALRTALISRIWLLAAAIPDFSPQHGITRETLFLRLLQLDVPASLSRLAQIFPKSSNPATSRDYGEPQGSRSGGNYAREHEAVFEPMGRLFDLVREIGTAITHANGAFG
jgi:phosphoenolpyruvate carboxylase